MIQQVIFYEQTSKKCFSIHSTLLRLTLQCKPDGNGEESMAKSFRETGPKHSTAPNQNPLKPQSADSHLIVAETREPLIRIHPNKLNSISSSGKCVSFICTH